MSQNEQGTVIGKVSIEMYWDDQKVKSAQQSKSQIIKFSTCKILDHTAFQGFTHLCIEGLKAVQFNVDSDNKVGFNQETSI